MAYHGGLKISASGRKCLMRWLKIPRRPERGCAESRVEYRKPERRYLEAELTMSRNTRSASDNSCLVRGRRRSSVSRARSFAAISVHALYVVNPLGPVGDVHSSACDSRLMSQGSARRTRIDVSRYASSGDGLCKRSICFCLVRGLALNGSNRPWISQTLAAISSRPGKRFPAPANQVASLPLMLGQGSSSRV
jgi:hypothetical protein